ncbi:MAG TPA: hypothetical protein PLX69_23560, partial [Leptospiraceae bacterium]|nr:hypothetical protein [Leptospiraceae bacterium]
IYDWFQEGRDMRGNFLSILFWIFLLFSCNSNIRQEKVLDSDAKEFLKSIKRYVVVVGSFESIVSSTSSPTEASSYPSKNKIQIEIKQATLGSSKNSLPVNIDPKLITTNNISNAIEKIGNTKAKQINIEELGLVSTDTNEERMHWLKTAGVDAIVEINYENLKLDYNTRVPDLSILNIFYTFLLLDIWWIDMVGVWYLEGDVNVKITNLSNGKQYSATSIYKKTSTGNFFLRSIDSKSMNESISKITQSAMAKIINSGSSL